MGIDSRKWLLITRPRMHKFCFIHAENKFMNNHEGTERAVGGAVYCHKKMDKNCCLVNNWLATTNKHYHY